MEDVGMNSPNRILFDKRSLRRYKIIMIIAAVMVAAGVLTGLLWDIVLGKSFTKYGVMITMFLINIGIPLFLIFLYNYLEAAIYLRRLKKNGYEVPDNLKDYGGNLEALPHTREPVAYNLYASDSTTAAWFSLGIYSILVILDVLYYVTWYRYEADSIALFILILIALSIFPILAFVFFRQSNRNKYIDYTDIKDGRRKVRSHLFSSIVMLLIFAAIAGFGIACADSMTRYIYRSRYSSHDKRNEDFYAGASMEISSDDLNVGEWSSELETRAPQLSFDEVDGAAYYVVYMVDENNGCPVAWYIEHTNDTEFDAGSAAGVYNGISAHPDSPHRYSITVYALTGTPDDSLTIDPEREHSFSPMDMYYDILNVTDRSHNPPLYGNVISYGYIYGVY